MGITLSHCASVNKLTALSSDVYASGKISACSLVLCCIFMLSMLVLVYMHYTHTHTTVLLLFCNMSGITWLSRYQKGKNQEG